ncbi:MAG: cupin domain-containing protein [Lachnospiraceae bacterium]|nr:cupin domain-containing protein [Lachnospiraceae bacterium]
MSYHVSRKAEAETYYPDLHYDMRGTRLTTGADVDGCLTVSLSHFLPGGGAKMSQSPVELVYLILQGEMTVTTDDGKSHVLYAGDSIHFSPMQGRESVNNGTETAQMLVIMCPPKA